LYKTSDILSCYIIKNMKNSGISGTLHNTNIINLF
jgi:hypothetical protein